MASILFGGKEIHTSGNLPETGSLAPDFSLTKTDLSDISLKDLKGKKVLLNIFPSLGTPVCASSIRKFNEMAASKENAVVLCISKDLPFAHSSFCEAEGIEGVISASEYKSNSFEDAYKVTIQDGAFTGLFSRAVVVIDEEGKVVYTEQVKETGEEPDYEKALAALS